MSTYSPITIDESLIQEIKELVKQENHPALEKLIGKDRNFFDEKEKDKVFKYLKEQFLNTNLGYLSSPGFPCKLILRKYKEARSRQDLLLKKQQPETQKQQEQSSSR